MYIDNRDISMFGEFVFSFLLQNISFTTNGLCCPTLKISQQGAKAMLNVMLQLWPKETL